MEKYLDKIILFALEHNVTDIHFYVSKGNLTIYMRNADGMFLYEENGDLRILEYLRYITNMDMSSAQKMQSGSCTLNYSDNKFQLDFLIFQQLH